MAAKFGTSGLRGLVEDLVGEPTTVHVRAFIRHLKARGLVKTGDAVCVGQDFRPSSPQLRQDVAAGLGAEGLNEMHYGAVPTPALAFEAMRMKRAAIMVTGSHIPADRNGIKFYRPDGEITKDDEQAILAWVTKLRPVVKVGLHSEEQKPDAFLRRYRKAFADKPLKGMCVGIYQHSSVARDMLVELLGNCGADAVPLGRSDDFVPVDTEAVSRETIGFLKHWCAQGRYDAIVSADGDGDRPLIADENGEVLRGDLVGLITARFLGAQTVVTPITSNSGLDAFLPNATRRTKVGSPFVIAEMHRAKDQGAKAIVGFEANGGFFTLSRFKRGTAMLMPLPTRDCFLPIFAVLATCAVKEKSLSALAACYGLPIALADRLEGFPQSKSADLMRKLAASPANRTAFFKDLGQIGGCDQTDGLRMTFDGGNIVHLRPSGNAPEFRCYVEAKTLTEAQDLLHRALTRVALEV